MNSERTHELRSQATGQRIVSLRYDAESGYVVIALGSGDELWVAACYEEGYHIVYAAEDTEASKRLPLSDRGCIVEVKLEPKFSHSDVCLGGWARKRASRITPHQICSTRGPAYESASESHAYL